LAPVFAAWGLVVVGRPVCLVAQRVPLLVHVVRRVRQRRSRLLLQQSAELARGTAAGPRR
ncbi:MAG: hypothetical protein M3P93_01945, partial [Actinomycetota bacterium]|nr:hypothetical protein [Actinomycetota bacterium]